MKKNLKVHNSDLPWKKKESGARLSPKEIKLQKKGIKERAQMEKKSVQKVIIYPHKTGFGFITPKKFKAFTITLEIPIKRSDFYKRMQLAFPKCIWKGEK
jgi:hypothetical protein